MLLWRVMVPSCASHCCTLVLRAAVPKYWPLMTPTMLPQLPRGAPVTRGEENGEDWGLPTQGTSIF